MPALDLRSVPASARSSTSSAADLSSRLELESAREREEEATHGGRSPPSESELQEVFSRIRHSRTKEAEALFKKGVPADMTDGAGNSLLHVACVNNQRKAAKLVLKWTDFKTTPPALDVINRQNHQGNTALHYCFAYDAPHP